MTTTQSQSKIPAESRERIAAYPVETLRATWEMRVRFPHHTAAEFAEMLTSLGVPDAAAQVNAAHHWDFYLNR